MKNSKVLTGCNISDEVWFDFVEDELEPQFKKDLNLHLKSCSKCQAVFAEIKVVRQALNQISDPVLPGQPVFDALEKKIMGNLDKKEVQGVAGEAPRSTRPFWVRRLTIPVAAAAALGFLVFGSLFTTPSFRGPTSIDAQNGPNLEEQIIVQTASYHPESFGDTIIGHQESDDIVMDAAASKLSRMSDTDAQAMLDNLK